MQPLCNPIFSRASIRVEVQMSVSLGNISAGDQSNLALDATLSLKLLYKSFIEGGNVTNAVDGTRKIGGIPSALTAIDALGTGTTPAAPTTNANSLVVNVLTNDAFKDAYPDSLFTGLSSLNGNIHVRKYDATTKQFYEVLQSDADVPTTKQAETDVNVYAWLNGLTDPKFKLLAATLRDLKVAYQLLDDGIYTSMMSQADPSKLTIFPNVSEYGVHDLILHTNASKLVPKIVNNPTHYNNTPQDSVFSSDVNNFTYFARTLDPITQDIFAVRRLILATYLMAQARLFSRMYFALRNPPGTSSGTAPVTASGNILTAGKLAHYFYARLMALNTNYESSRLNTSSLGDASNKAITKSIQDNVAIYSDNTIALAKINDGMVSKKRALANEIGRVQTERKDAGYSKRLVVAAIVLALTLLLVLFAIFVMPVDAAIRVKVASMVVVIALVIAGVLVILQRRNINEGFIVSSGGLNTGFSASLQVDSRAQFDLLMKMIDLVFTEELRNFYRYTIELTLMLKNNRLYNELNYNTSKERSWFENNQFQLNKAVNDARTAQRLFDRKTKMSTALLRLVLQILVIVAFVVLGVAAVQDIPALVKVIYVIGGILGILAVLYFFGDVLRRTYVDGDRLYWGTPSAVKDL